METKCHNPFSSITSTELSWDYVASFHLLTFTQNFRIASEVVFVAPPPWMLHDLSLEGNNTSAEVKHTGGLKFSED